MTIRSTEDMTGKSIYNRSSCKNRLMNMIKGRPYDDDKYDEDDDDESLTHTHSFHTGTTDTNIIIIDADDMGDD